MAALPRNKAAITSLTGNSSDLGAGDAVWTALPVTGRVPGAPCILDLPGRGPIESRIPVDPSGPVDARGCDSPWAADADTGIRCRLSRCHTGEDHRRRAEWHCRLSED